MSSLNLVRGGAIGFILGGIVWVVLGLLIVFRVVWNPATGARPAYFILFIVAMLLSSLGLVGLHALQKQSYGRIGRAGLYTALIATAAQILAVLVLLSGSSALAWLANPVGTLGVLVGFVLYGAATLQARVLPRWYGVALIIALPVSIASASYGNVLFGLVLLVLGYVLWSRRDASTGQPGT